MFLDPPAAPDGIPNTVREPLPNPGSGARLWLVRHPAVHASAQGNAYGCADVALSEAGADSIPATAANYRSLGVAAVRSSPLTRARRLAEAIAAACQAPLSEVAELREIDRGDWQGLALAEYERRWAAERAAFWKDPWTWSPPGGESDAELTERAWPVFVEASQSGATQVLVTHQNVIRVLVAAALGIPAGRSHALHVDPSCAVLIVDHPNGWTLERSNATNPGGGRVADL